MSYLLSVTVATVLLVVFLLVNAFSLVVRELQHKRHQRERQTLLDSVNKSLQGMVVALKEKNDLTDENEAARRLDAAMRRTIAEGIDLAKMLDAKQTQFGALVQERRGQIAVEVSTLETWAKIRDDLTAWADKYPAYCFTNDGGEG